MLEETTKVDVITRDASGDSYALFIVVADGEWGRDDWRELLRAKIANYATYVLDGQLIEHYPECHGRPVRVAIHSGSEPPREAAELAERAEAALAEYELAVTFEELPG